MSTKDLSRTVIEGGRRRFNTWERRASNGFARVKVRAWLRGGAEGFAPRRKKVRREFHDRLSAAERWLEKQCGRRWDDVHAELMATFDTRTIAGRHIVFDHLLRDVGRPWFHDARWYDFLVDDEGVLYKQPPRRWKRTPVVPPLPADVVAWAAGRRVGRRGRHWYWFVPVAAAEGSAPPRFRQGGELSGQEVQRWESLRDDARDQLRMKLPDASSVA